jgi:hypothetical protein
MIKNLSNEKRSYSCKAWTSTCTLWENKLNCRQSAAGHLVFVLSAFSGESSAVSGKSCCTSGATFAASSSSMAAFSSSSWHWTMCRIYLLGSGCGFLLRKPIARARMGLDFGISLQSRPWVHKQARPAKVRARILQTRPGPIMYLDAHRPEPETIMLEVCS